MEFSVGDLCLIEGAISYKIHYIMLWVTDIQSCSSDLILFITFEMTTIGFQLIYTFTLNIRQGALLGIRTTIDSETCVRIYFQGRYKLE